MHFWFNYLNPYFIYWNLHIQIDIKILLLLLVEILLLFLLSNVHTSKKANVNSESCVFVFSFSRFRWSRVFVFSIQSSRFSFYMSLKVNPAVIYCAIFVFLKYSFWLIRKFKKDERSAFAYMCVCVCILCMYLTQPSIWLNMLLFLKKFVFLQAK